MSLAERLAAGLVRMPNGCLEWTGRTNNGGYGLISGGAQVKAHWKDIRTHRLAWELANGPIPEGMVVRHFVCDNPPCVDVTHLALGTHADNVADMDAKGRRRNGNEAKTHCPANHPYDEVNTYIGHGGKRHCKECIKAHRAARTRARRAAKRLAMAS